MKRLLLVFLVLGIIIGGIFRIIDNDDVDNGKFFSFEERLKKYVASEFNHGYYCDELEGSKYFFDFVYFPYKKDGEYLVSFGLGGYTKTQLGNITSCGGGGEILIVKDDGEEISLVHKFDEFKVKNLPKDITKLLNSKKIKRTTYEQAKKYFEIDENPKISQKCPKYLCNRSWYQILEDEDDDKTNDNIFVYSTTPPKEMKSDGKWWMLNFVDEDHSITEIDRSCPNNENDGRCSNITKWKMINKNTISYPLIGDPDRENRIEIIEVSKDILKFIHLYD